MKRSWKLSFSKTGNKADQKPAEIPNGSDVSIDAPMIDARARAELKAEQAALKQKKSANQEYGGPKGLEPTRYGDWEKAGRCVDF